MKDPRKKHPFAFKRKQHPESQAQPTLDSSQMKAPLSSSSQEIMNEVKRILTTDDLACFPLQEDLCCIYLDTMLDMTRYEQEIVTRLNLWLKEPEQWKRIYPQAKSPQDMAQLIHALLDGHVVLMTQRTDTAIVIAIPLSDLPKRAISEPKIEKFILGPKDSFVEDLNTNIALLRHRNRDPNLVIHYFEVGERSKTRVGLIYVKDICKPEWVEEIETNIKKINIEAVTVQKDLMELIIGRNNTPFPLYELSEIPARTSKNLTDGRIAIAIEGSPFMAFLPTVMNSMLIGSEYVFQGSIIPTFVRMLKYFAIVLSLYASSVYLALVTVNTTVLPTEFGLSIARDQAHIPYGPFFEVFIFMVILDLFVEGTSFVPGTIGPAINVFGSLVIGQAAAQAGLTSRVMIIVTALTVIGSYFASYQISFAFRIWKYPLIVGSALLGFYGITLVTVVLVMHLSALKSLGVPYLSAFAPNQPRDYALLGFFERDKSKQKKRMSNYEPQDHFRQKGDPDS
ncbi:spore germination protein [Paenibacillus swuensis]|uniref:spore germination protein n=1 Tax=Paenibacillus swuensis TaxID=1178515 RepID=UPI000838A941|nr:spore germination protein [Paenibacillus swuensis]